jgi:hypothetical protein
MLPTNRRVLVKSEQLAEDLKRCGVTAKRLDDLMDSLCNSLSAAPEVFQKDEVAGWSRVIVRECPPDIPAIRIWFTYDDNQTVVERVDLLSEYL